MRTSSTVATTVTRWWANSVGTEYSLASKRTSDSESTHRGSTRAATNASAGSGSKAGRSSSSRSALVAGLPQSRRARSSRQRALEVGVERLQAAVHGGDRHEEVAAGVADERLDVPLLVGPPHQAEVGLEQVVALEPQERVGDLAVAAAGDLGDGDLAVVVADPPGHAAEEGEGPDVALEERLGALAREGADRRWRRSTAGS